ncbi:MAG: recombinase family protein [Bilifractor sp.]
MPEPYVGDLVQGRRRTRHYKGEERHFTDKEEWMICENTHEAIVSREVYDRVQDILAAKAEGSTFRSDRTKNIRIKPNRYSGILFCGICGAKLAYQSEVRGPDRQRKYYFNCTNSYDHEIEAHNGIRITERTLEDLLKKLIGELLRSFNKDSQLLVLMMEKELKKGLAYRKKDIRKISNKLEKMEASEAARYEAYVLGELPRDAAASGHGKAPADQRHYRERYVPVFP